ncbi:protein artemis [Cimex lectularius]|uniref:Protein artemis n=1 Tax=Cimex lectularius TaxID=79782 RepID=A0A8I6TH45_CIMLE|nr:protein artemis [Cimex lectularius]XP_014259134.1 protein artemis [Cimex lectularius]XP_014259135.1 protein artemis [Cimex lectularius]XP_014259136.1 protein artemis [Cimex lectularius]XP_014259137.1 protein artemis [Cimex lectularius]XP_024081960.1 protein artemis [Cimex lectularius]XP_024081961.1 protein artemis [Cimex lectularius]
MSIFSGVFQEKELCGIQIDKFELNSNSKPKIFFLTHYHSDHIVGLNDLNYINYFNENDDVYLYCSEITKKLIKKNIVLNEKRIIIHEEGAVVICPNDEWIKVTALRAGHCPGSLMYLFESNISNVLFTGDFRLSMRDVKLCKSLKSIKLDKIYLDTTFASPSYPSFPTREESFKCILKLITNKEQEGNSVLFIIKLSANVGQEFLMVKIYEALGRKIYIEEKVAMNYTSSIKQLVNVVTPNPQETNIHFYFSENLIQEKARKVVNAVIIKPTAQWFHRDNLINGPLQKDYSIWRVAYSSHSSLEELSEFVKYLKPAEIVPIAFANKVRIGKIGYTFEKMTVDEMLTEIQCNNSLHKCIRKREHENPLPNFKIAKKLKVGWEEELKIMNELGELIVL